MSRYKKQFTHQVNKAKISCGLNVRNDMRLYTPFEIWVNRDMLFNGYNPLDPKDILNYWKEKLS